MTWRGGIEGGKRCQTPFPALSNGKNGIHFDKALDEAQAKGWTVVDMKRDWKRVFPFDK